MYNHALKCAGRTATEGTRRGCACAPPWLALCPPCALTVRHRRCDPANEAIYLNRGHPRAGKANAAASSAVNRSAAGVQDPHRVDGAASETPQRNI